MVFDYILCFVGVLVFVITWAFFFADTHQSSKGKMRDKNEHDNEN